MRLFTVGFTKKNAESFFETLRRAGVRRVVDVRLHNVSQLAGFTKRDDLAYFLKKIGGIDYLHEPRLAPSAEMLDEYKKHKGSWDEYEERFLNLMKHRQIEDALAAELSDGDCLLCSEEKPHHCHRRLVAEYLRDRWGDIEIEHLV